MKCVNCGNEVSNNDSVCPFCGTSRAVNLQMQQTEAAQSGGQNYRQQTAGSFCVLCGKPVPSGYKTCPECTQRRLEAESTPKKKKSYIWLVVLILVLLCLSVSVVIAYQNDVFSVIFAVTEDDYDEASDEREDEEESAKDDEESVSEEDGKQQVSDEEKRKSKEGETEKVSTYELIAPNYSDRIITWSEAESAAQNSGGHLVSINSREELDKITSMADEQGIVILWIGAKRKSGQSWDEVKWLDGTKMTYTKWLENEPTYASDGEEETCLMVFKVGDSWYFNDAANDITKHYLHLVGKTAYIVEKEQ